MKVGDEVEVSQGDYEGRRGFITGIIFDQCLVTFSNGETRVFFRNWLKVI